MTRTAQLAKPSTPAKTLLSGGLLVTAAMLTLSGCGNSDSAAAGTTGGAGTSGVTSQSAKSAKTAGAQTSGAASQSAQQDANQIEGAVNDAQSTLDGLDQDFAGDDTDTNTN